MGGNEMACGMHTVPLVVNTGVALSPRRLRVGSLLLASFLAWIPSSPPQCPVPSSSHPRIVFLFLAPPSPRERGGDVALSTQGWSWSWPCGGRVVVVVDVEVVWAVEVVWVVEVVVNMVGGRRGGGRLGVVGVGDGHRRGGDRRGKVDTGGLSSCRRRGVVGVWSLSCRRRGEVDTGGRRRVVNVARSTWGLVVVSSMWCGHGWDVVVVVVASSTWGVVAWHGGRSSTWRSSSMGSSSSSTRRGGCRLPRRGVAGVVVVVDMAWGRRRPQPGLALGEHS